MSERIVFADGTVFQCPEQPKAPIQPYRDRKREWKKLTVCADLALAKEKFVDGVNVYDQPVVIEDGVWCGANVTILKGVTIGRGSVVAAGAVVTKSFPPYSIIGGIPAKLIKMRFTEEEIKKNENDLSLSAHSI